MKFTGILLSLLLLTLASCHQHGNPGSESPGMQDGGGIGVGNAMEWIVYHSPHGFRLSYPKPLSLTSESDEKHVEINNSKIEPDARLVSKVIVDVKETVDFDFDTYAKNIRQENPGVDFKEAKFTGARALNTEKIENARSQGTYHVLSGSGQTFVIKYDVYEKSLGAGWFAAVIKSLSFDENPPVIKSLRFESADVMAGEAATVLFEAEDDLSGLNLSSVHVTLMTTNDDKDAAQIDLDATAVPAFEHGPNVYAVKIPIDRWKPNARFFLTCFRMRDQTGNWRVLLTPMKNLGEGNLQFMHEKGLAVWRAGKRDPQTRFDMIYFNVKNLGSVDTQAPYVKEITLPLRILFLKGKDETRRVLFRINADVSGVLEGGKACGEFMALSRVRVHRISFCGPIYRFPYTDDENEYFVEYVVKKGYPSAIYPLTELQIWDRAGNRTTLALENPFDFGVYRQVEKYERRTVVRRDLPIKFIQLINEDGTEIYGPEVSEFAPLGPIKAGQKGELRFRATDPAGISLACQNTSAGQASCGEFARDGADSDAVRIALMGPIRKIAGEKNLYALDFEVPTMIKPGRYFLTSFTLVDANDNPTYLDSTSDFLFYKLKQERFSLFDGRRVGWLEQGGPRIPILVVQP